MTPHQKAELLEAAEAGDSVRVVTLALAAAAHAARLGSVDEAHSIRRAVDSYQRQGERADAYRERRFQVALQLACASTSPASSIGCNDWIDDSLRRAEEFIAAADARPIPEGALG